MAKIGFIGLGHMGSPMVLNLLAKNHTVVVYDLLPETVTAVAEQGAVPVSSIGALAEQSEVVFTMLQTGEQVAEVCLAPEGLFASLRQQGLYIDCSSIDINTCQSIHKTAEEQGIAMVDAPVSGGVAGAKAASLTIMVGGSYENYQRAKIILDCLGKRVIHAGAPGTGQVAKICNNMILGISMIAVSEAFVLAEKLGLDPTNFFEIATRASGQCWAMSQYCPVPGILDNVPANNHYQPGFTAAMMLKDLNLSQNAAQHAQCATPLGAEATALYALFVNAGHADLDFSGILKLIAGQI